MKQIIIFCTLFVRFSCGDNRQSPKIDDYFTNISLQNVFSSDTKDRNQNITNTIVDASAEFYTDHTRGYSPIRLKLDTQNLAREKSILIDLGSANLSIRNFTVSGKYHREYSLKTEIQCYPSKNIAIEVALPTEVNIAGTFTIIHTDDNSTHEGSFSTRILNGNITKYFIIVDNEIQSISYVPSLISEFPLIQFKTDKKSETLLGNKSAAIRNKFESLLGSIFEHQLTEEITTNKKSLALFCSKIINIDQTNPTFLNDIFVIPTPTSDLWNGLNLTFGPIIFDGLTYFNTVKLSITENIFSESNTDYNTKNIAFRLRIGVLKGTFQWTYNDEEENQSRTFIEKFSTQGVDFEAPFYRNGGSCGMSWNTHVDEIQIEINRDESCVDEHRIINGFVSEILRTIITNSLQNAFKIEWRTRNLAGYGCGYY